MTLRPSGFSNGRVTKMKSKAKGLAFLYPGLACRLLSENPESLTGQGPHSEQGEGRNPFAEEVCWGSANFHPRKLQAFSIPPRIFARSTPAKSKKSLLSAARPLSTSFSKIPPGPELPSSLQQNAFPLTR